MDFEELDLKVALKVVEKILDHFKKEKLLSQEELEGAYAVATQIELILFAD